MNHDIIGRACMSQSRDCCARLRHFAIVLVSGCGYANAIVFLVGGEGEGLGAGGEGLPCCLLRWCHRHSLLHVALAARLHLLQILLLLVNGCIRLADASQCAFHLHHVGVLGLSTVVGLHSPVVENLATLVELERL